jgi:NAD(P)-dependent dehydrogenase (short-subunit alcohol dehydrogenase family)
VTPQKPVLLITGASRGIGAACAKLAGARGFQVGVNYLRDRRAADEVIAAIEANGGKALAIRGDMKAEADIARVLESLERAFGRLTHLVYNSGITGTPSRLEAAKTDMLREVLDLNVLGALLCVRAAVPRISTQHGGAGGAIVLISSAAASLGSPGEYVWYAASKGAVDSMTIGLARELAGDGIRVNGVAPGLIATEMHRPGRLERLAPAVPMARAGSAQEVAEAVLFLLSDAASYVTGATLRVTGGR